MDDNDKSNNNECSVYINIGSSDNPCSDIEFPKLTTYHFQTMYHVEEQHLNEDLAIPTIQSEAWITRKKELNDKVEKHCDLLGSLIKVGKARGKGEGILEQEQERFRNLFKQEIDDIERDMCGLSVIHRPPQPQPTVDAINTFFDCLYETSPQQCDKQLHKLKSTITFYDPSEIFTDQSLEQMRSNFMQICLNRYNDVVYLMSGPIVGKTKMLVELAKELQSRNTTTMIITYNRNSCNMINAMVEMIKSTVIVDVEHVESITEKQNSPSRRIGEKLRSFGAFLIDEPDKMPQEFVDSYLRFASYVKKKIVCVGTFEQTLCPVSYPIRYRIWTNDAAIHTLSPKNGYPETHVACGFLHMKTMSTKCYEELLCRSLDEWSSIYRDTKDILCPSSDEQSSIY